MRKLPDRIFTKIVGTTFEGRQELVRKAREAQVKALLLQREPDNKYDPNALAVYANIPEMGLTQLGYVSNGVYECLACGFLVDAKGRGGGPSVCPECDGVEFERMGLATELSAAIDSGINYMCIATEYTGGELNADGSEKKNLGVNIFIETNKMTEPIIANESTDSDMIVDGKDHYGSLQEDE